MSTTVVKIVLDTNILISIIGRKSPFRWIFDGIIHGNIILCVSNEIIFEYKEILQLKNGVEVADNMIDFFTIHPFVEKRELYYNFQLITEDQDDNKFVDCAIAANAYCIVSNDKHYRVLKDIDFPRVNIMTLEGFEREFKQKFITK